MKSEQPPRDLPPLTAAAAQQLQAWQQLRDQMQVLYAELEYLRLMLRINANK
jgi:hypothetical protein